MKTDESAQKKPEWQIIFENIKVDIPHKEWTAKFLAGIELQWLGKDRVEWEDMEEDDDMPCGFCSWVEFREKPQKIKYQTWCVDYIQSGRLEVGTFETKKDALDFLDDVIVIVKDPYLKEYEL